MCYVNNMWRGSVIAPEPVKSSVRLARSDMDTSLSTFSFINIFCRISIRPCGIDRGG